MLPVPLLAVLGVTGVGGVVAYKRSKSKKKITDERKRVFEHALKTLKDPQRLRSLAATFDKEGLRLEAKELRKRANVIDAPKATKAAREAVFKKALTSKDPVAVKKTASAFHNQGYYDAAKKLRAYAAGLTAKKSPNARIAGEPEFEPGNDEFAGDDEMFETESDEFVENETEFEPEGSVESVDAVVEETGEHEENADEVDVPHGSAIVETGVVETDEVS